MTTYSNQPTLRGALFASLGLAAVWAIAAINRPTATYHLAPILIAGLAPFMWRDNPRSAAAAALAGTSIAMGLSFALAGLNLLRGPSLLPSGGALLELLVFAVAGGTGGWLVAAMAAKAR